MKVSTVKEFNSGMPVQDLIVRLTAVYQPYHGKGKAGPFTVFNCIGKDDTGEIKIAWFDPVFDPMSLKNQLIKISATENRKGTLSGAKVKLSEYTDRQGNQVSEKEIQINGDGAQPYSDDAKAAATPYTPPRNGEQSSGGGGGGGGEARRGYAVSLVDFLAVADALHSHFEKLYGDTEQAVIATSVNTGLIALTKGDINYSSGSAEPGLDKPAEDTDEVTDDDLPF